MTTPSYDAVHVPESSRFEVRADGQTAVLTYRLTGDGVVLEHTVVPDALEGRGIGSVLAKAALTWARDEDLTVTPQCTFVQGWLARHPDVTVRTS